MDETQARSLIAEHLGVSPALAGDKVELAELGADPLDVAAVVLRVEKAYGVRISDACGESCRTVGDVVSAVHAALERKAERPAIGLRWASRT